ncbi:hypothetical protein ACWGJP_10560 [Microbacterium sp. NPDC055903]
MSEGGRFESERSAWIKGRRWLDRAGAARRAEILARRARQRDRATAGLGDAAFAETETKGSFHRWTRHEDATTSALGLVAWVLVYGWVLPVWFGLAWLIGWVSYRGWELAADRYRVRVWPYLVAATLAGAFAVIGRPLGWDLWAIHAWAGVIETVTGGRIAPAVLSHWYAAGWISWLEIQVPLGLLLGGWYAYAWGWGAPAVRRASAVSAPSTTTRSHTPSKVDSVVRIISKGEQS